MDRRWLFQDLLEVLCDRVYFQPPPGFEMSYPCIVYHREPANTQYADNNPFVITQQYEVTLITEDPDDPIRHKLVAMPSSRHDNHFVKDNLNHDAFSIYF